MAKALHVAIDASNWTSAQVWDAILAAIETVAEEEVEAFVARALIRVAGRVPAPAP